MTGSIIAPPPRERNDLAVATKAIPEEEQVSEPVDAWIFPTSFAQRRLWFIDQLEPGSTLYNVPGAFRIRGRIEAALLERAFGEVIARHEILRTTFRAIDGEPMQIVSAESDFHLAGIDLSALPGPARQAEVARLIREDSERPFDLANGPLLRAALLELSPAEQVLILCIHHIITDSWSQEVLMRELTSACARIANGGSPALPELPIQYADFAAWQRDAMQGEMIKKELAWWRKDLAGLAPLDLPRLPAASQARSNDGGTYYFEMPERLAGALRTLAQREGVTLFMVLLAGWKIFLARYAGQRDIAVGSPISDRSRTETEGLIGFFLNTLVLRTSLDGNPTVRETLFRVRDTALEAFAHQNVPFEMIVEDSHPARQPGENPLFCVMFVLMSGEEKSWRLPGASMEPLLVDESKAKFDLTLHLRDTGRVIRGALVYGKAAFTAAMARQAAGHYETLLAGMAASAEARINTLPLMSPDERDLILRGWNDTDSDFPADRTLQDLFREQARLNPGAIAIEDGGAVVNYALLDRQSDAIAAALYQRGVRAGEAVAICLPRSAGLIAGILGILKAGAAWVPLDASHPASRLEVMVRQSRAKLVIGDRVGPMGGIPSLSLEQCLTQAGPLPSQEPGASTDVACIMFTSGSTGVPKGVRVLHRGISRLVINTNYVEFTAKDVVAHASNTSFDASTFEIWGALLNGARLVIVPPDTVISPNDFAAFLRERKISILFLTTPLFHQLAREIPGAFGGLRYLVAGGDALQAEAARAVLEAAAPGCLVNGYGPTEVTTFAVCHHVNGLPPDAATIPIGRPISNTRAYILDAALEPVPVGVAGELYLGGPGVAGGYIDNPEATAAAFVPDPFSGDPSARLYKSGDLARWREDGVIEFLGRADGQVKIRGFRVEPGEIETALMRHPRVRQAIVVGRADSTGQKQLAAYMVAHPGTAPSVIELREHLLASLPDYMVPVSLTFLDALPLNPNGKVDLAALPDAASAENGSAASESPGTWMETALVEIWESMLECRGIGVTDDFFNLGGHSLLAIRMLAEVEKRTGIKIPPRVLFEAPTIRRLAIASRRPAPVNRSAIVPVQTTGTLPPFFFLHGDFVEGGLYSIKMARHIGPERPFYAIDPHGVHDEAPHSIEEMAAARLELVRQVRPHGPYVLGGYCNGGLVAFEMARQLEAAGETVSSLILVSVDGSNAEFSWLERLISLLPGRSERKFRAFIEWRERILFARAAWQRQLDALVEPVPISSQPARVARKLARIVRKAFGLMLPRPAPDGAAMDTAQPEAAGVDVGRIYHEACTAYVPRPYRGAAHVLWPGEMTLRDPFAGWGSVMPQIHLIQVPGGHFSSLQGENLMVVSEQIRACLLADRA